RTVTLVYFIFFFQAEDGIRDFHVTGVQTCALPICGTQDTKRTRVNLGISPRMNDIFTGKIYSHPLSPHLNFSVIKPFQLLIKIFHRVFVNSIFQKSFESKLDIRLQIFPMRKVFVNMNIDFPVFSFFDIIFAFCCSFLFLRHYSPSSSMRTSEMYLKSPKSTATS